MSFSSPGSDLAQILDMAVQHGYDGIEPRAGHAHGVEPERTSAERRGIRRRVDAAGLSLCCLAIGGGFADPQRAPGAVESTRRWIDLARDLGCPRLRVFGGKIGEGLSRRGAIDLVATSLGSLAPEAAAAGVTVCLETHDDWTAPEHVAAVMEAVDHPAIGVNWDLLHPSRSSGVRVEDGFARLRRWIHHVHIHDALMADPLQLRRLGEGELDVRAAFRCLVQTGYRGWLSGEWIDADAIIDLADELRRMKTMERETRRWHRIAGVDRSRA